MCCGLGILGCCFCSAATSLCGSACSSCHRSRSTRVSYILIILFAALVASIFLIPQFQVAVIHARNPSSTNVEVANLHVQSASSVNIDSVTARILGFAAVYRICLPLACYFALSIFIMIGVRSSSDPRASLQNGFWFFKMLVIVGGVIGFFFFPRDGLDYAGMILSSIGGFIFIMLQLLFLFDLASKINKRCLSSYEENGSRCAVIALVFLTILCYAAFIAVTVLLYYYYSQGASCSLQKFFITINLVVCIALSIVSVLPPIREANSNTGLLQSSFVSLYIIYVTWSSLTNSSDANCNPGLNNLVNITIYEQVNIGPINIHSTDLVPAGAWVGNVPIDYNTFVALAIMLLSLLYVSASQVHHHARSQIKGTSDEEEDQGGSDEWDDESDAVDYNYSVFHLLFVISVLYVCATLTRWSNPRDEQTVNGEVVLSVNGEEAAMWVKICASWCSLLLYLWLLIAPIVLKSRQF